MRFRKHRRWHNVEPLDARRVNVGGFPVPRRFDGGFNIDGWPVAVVVRVWSDRVVAESVEIGGRERWDDDRGVVEPSERARRMLDGRKNGTTLPVGPAELRKIAKVLDREVAELVAMWSPRYEDEHGPYTRTSERQRIVRAAETGAARRTLTPEHLQRVADVYRRNPDAPRQAVAAQWGVSPDNASKWICAAREQGYLGEAPKPGVSGERGKS